MASKVPAPPRNWEQVAASLKNRNKPKLPHLYERLAYVEKQLSGSAKGKKHA